VAGGGTAAHVEEEEAVSDPRRIDERTGFAIGPPKPDEDSTGYLGITYRQRDPRCKGKCTAKERPAYDSPAKLGTQRGTNRKVVYCPCCMNELHRDEMQPTVAGNLNPALVAGRHVRFVDRICGYDVVLLWDVREA
jgi:hypothetical protein